MTKRFVEIHIDLFGPEDRHHTQVDWIRARSRFQVFLVDTDQTVRTSDVPREVLDDLVHQAAKAG